MIKYLESDQEPFNIYLMDIEMPLQNGIETAAYNRKADRNAIIIFITSHKEYVYEVFEVLPFRFLCKPVQFDSMKTVLQDAFSISTTKIKFSFFRLVMKRDNYLIVELSILRGPGERYVSTTQMVLRNTMGRFQRSCLPTGNDIYWNSNYNCKTSIISN